RLGAPSAPEACPILPPPPPRICGTLAAADQIKLLLEHAELLVFERQKTRCRFADYFGAAIAEQPFCSSIPARYPAVHVSLEQRVFLHVLDEQPQALLARAQRLLTFSAQAGHLQVRDDPSERLGGADGLDQVIARAGFHPLDAAPLAGASR